MVTTTELKELRERVVRGDSKVKSEILSKADAAENEARRCQKKIASEDHTFHEQLRLRSTQEDHKQLARQLRAILVNH